MEKELKRKLLEEILTPRGFLFNRVKAIDAILALDEMTPEAQEKIALEAKIKERDELTKAVAEAQAVLAEAVPRLDVLIKELPVTDEDIIKEVEEELTAPLSEPSNEEIIEEVTEEVTEGEIEIPSQP